MEITGFTETDFADFRELVQVQYGDRTLAALEVKLSEDKERVLSDPFGVLFEILSADESVEAVAAFGDEPCCS